MQRSIGTKWLAAAALATCAAVLGTTTATHAGSAPPAEQPEDLREIRVGSIPIFNNALLFVADANGYFADEGLAVEIVPSTNFGAGLAAVLNGELNFSFASSIPVMAAAGQGAPVVWAAGGEVISSDVTVDDSPDVVATNDPDIESVLDLEGKTIALNALNNINSLAIQTAMAEAGGDPESIEFIEMPYPDMLPTLEAGRVDAVAIVEPFVSQARAQELTIVEGALWADGLPDGALIDGYFTRQALIDDDPDLVAAFARAIERAAEFATDDLPAVREILPDYVGVDPEVAEAANFYPYDAVVDTEQLDGILTRMVDHGFLDEAFDLESMIHTR